MPTWTGYTDFNKDSNSDRWDLQVGSGYFYDFSLNSAGYFELTTPEVRSQNSDVDSAYDGEWVLLSVS